MPEIQIGNITIKMTVDEFIDFIKKTEPSEIATKLQALAKAKGETQNQPHSSSES